MLLCHIAQASWFSATLTGLAVILGMMILYIAQPLPIARLDLKIYDSLLPLRAAPEPSPVPVIIDLDEASLREYGQWPWPRYLVADLLEALNGYGVAAIGLDIMFAEPDRSSPERLRESLRRDRDAGLNLDGLPPGLRDFDQLLADTLRQSPAILGFYARFDGTAGDVKMPASVTCIEQMSANAIPLERSLQSAGNAVPPLPVLRDKAPLGFINVAPDGDGIVRKAPLVIRVGEVVYPSLALRSLMLALGSKNLILRSGPYGLESIRVGQRTVPSVPPIPPISVDAKGAVYLPFFGPRKSYPYISAADVLRKNAPPAALQGRIAFVGTSAPGLLDIRATPLDPVYPGVEIHAAVVDAILTGNAVGVPSWTPAAQILGIFVSGLAAMLIFGFARPRIYLPVAAALVAAAVALSRHFFSRGLFLSPLYVVITITLMGACLVFLRFWQEERQKLILRNAFSRYVSPEIVKRITKLRGNLFAGEERELSILFTDIRGFTSLSEKLSPQQIVLLLNRYFTPMTALVREHSGTMDKFIGDALMAFWNAPLDVPGHPALAVSVAMAMQEKLLALNGELQAEFGVELRIGAGIHTGPVYVGNMGSAELVNYTLIGDNVNLASRLEGLCPGYGVGVVVSGETRAGCAGSFVFQYLDTIRVKGKSQPVSVYAPMRPEAGDARREELLAWDKACGFYRSGEFANAAAAFAGLCEQFPQAGLYAAYRERAQTLVQNPPEHWDGIWTATSK
ncbi:MAG: adenylate/guanylate cyclase domain-containing protein [Deltaproteobacteria bacterium]|jgi:adenylate cyclase|nr:adenylate/guanylate cyclase domain-containing protein [Deltaproteobacteria bacterium]